MTLIRPKGCERCGGDLFLESDHYGVFWQCLACATIYEKMVTLKYVNENSFVSKQVRHDLAQVRAESERHRIKREYAMIDIPKRHS